MEGSHATAQVGGINSELRLRVVPGPPCLESLVLPHLVLLELLFNDFFSHPNWSRKDLDILGIQLLTFLDFFHFLLGCPFIMFSRVPLKVLVGLKAKDL